MKSKEFIFSLLFLFVFFASANAGEKTMNDDPVISFFIGNITILRKGNLVPFKVGSRLAESDLIRVLKNAVIEFKIKRGSKVRVSGPNIFRYSSIKLKENIQRGNGILKLLKKIKKDAVPYYPQTVVTAVRGEEEETKRINALALKKIKLAVEYFQSDKLDESWKLIEEIERYKRLKRHTRSILTFYKAEIHFKKMNFQKALELYNKIYKKRFSRFKYREESLAHAVICSYYISDDRSFKTLTDDYLSIYGDDGKYWHQLKDLK